MDFFTLDYRGAALSLLFGLLFLLAGGPLGIFFLLVMVSFLVLSAAATTIGTRFKKRIGTYQEYRGISNVIANGLIPLILASLFYYFVAIGADTLAQLAAIGFIASVAAITSDKFASEIGVLGGQPRMIFSFKRVRRGTSGAISAVGLAASLLGSFAIALYVLLVGGYLGSLNPGMFGMVDTVIAITAAGFFGNLIDSMLGYYEEYGIGNKFSTNFICGLSGAIIAMLVFIAL